MDNKEMIEALAEHGKAIELKNADLQKAMEAKMTEAVTALKAELAEMVKTREVMQNNWMTKTSLFRWLKSPQTTETMSLYLWKRL